LKVPKSTAKPLIELTIASVFWGFGFVATIWSLQHLSVSAIIFYRFLIAFFAGLILLPLTPNWKKIFWPELRLSLPAGFFLGTTLLLQTWGLQYTTATKSAFITTLYVVIVPLIAHFLLGQKLRSLHWLWVLVATIGTLLISGLTLSGWTLGDSLTFLNAITASFHILYVGKVAARSSHHFTFNTFQSFWIMIISLFLIPFDDGNWSLSLMPEKAWMGLLSLSLGSSLLGFFLQVRAQKELNPSVAALLFLLESPMSFVFAYFLLGERLSPTQFLGAILILLACLGSTLRITQKKSV